MHCGTIFRPLKCVCVLDRGSGKMIFSRAMAMTLAMAVACVAQTAGAENSGSFTSIASLKHVVLARKPPTY